MEAKTGCKIRKRGCSSSSSSSLARRNRFKRAILVGKRTARGGGCSGTPAKPTTAGKSPVLMISPEKLRIEFQSGSVSARKLAATLWEIGNGISPPGNPTGDYFRGKQPARNTEKYLISLQNLAPNLSDPISGLGSDRLDRSTGDLIRRAQVVSQKFPVINYKTGGMDSMDTRLRGKCNVCLNDVSDSLTTSKEITKVLSHVQGVCDHDQQTPRKRLISALRCELDRARSILNRLIKEQRVTSEREIQCLMECFAEEKTEWRRKERERIREALMSVSREIGVERKLRKQTERLNKKLGRELADTRIMLSKAMKELQSEKRAKEILEQVCDELVRGVGEDKAEVEKLRKDAERVKEEVEKEREMMQIADILREERVQMKLSEAKYHFEEKNAAVEKLRTELEDYLRGRIDGGGGDMSPGMKRIKAILEEHTHGQAIGGDVNGGDDEGRSDQDSDLQSIELNMDSTSKSYKWSYVESGKICRRNCRKVRQKGTSLVDMDDAHKNDEDSDDSVERRSLIIDFQTPDPNINRLHNHIEGPDSLFEKKPLPRDPDQNQNRDSDEEEIDRDKSIKNLRNYIVSNMRIVNPSKQWNQSSMPCQGSDNLIEKVSSM